MNQHQTWSSFKTKIVKSILTDNLDETRRVLQQVPEELKLLADLVEKVQAQTLPLPLHKHSGPRFAISSVSYTCGVGCEMCWSGFSDKTRLFENYKNLSPSEFDDWGPWAEYGDEVMLVGLGETLDSPHIFDHLNKLRNKTTYLTTSGSTLTAKKAEKLIKSDLTHLSFSFDGETTAGHGSGDIDYSNLFWKNVTQLNALKDKLKASHPILRLQISVDLENLNQLQAIIEKAVAHDVREVELFYMIPSNKELFEKSVFSNYENSCEQIRKVLSYWLDKGLEISIYNRKELPEKPTSCHFADLLLIFNLDRYLPQPCCGPFKLPLETRSLTPDQYWNSFPFRYFRYLHANDGKEMVPSLCDSCWARDPNKFANSIKESFTSNKVSENLLPVYQNASTLKNQNKFSQAVEEFQRVINETKDSDLLGKSHFHIGEIELSQEHYENAFSHFREAIHYQFNHQMAFCYFYLLWVILDKNSLATNQE
ncbi:MAG: hypothetical protein F3745_08365 [Nitrospinae bacterium]|nr:hypothetical protein [Nitrospinota bacterium]